MSIRGPEDHDEAIGAAIGESASTVRAPARLQAAVARRARRPPRLSAPRLAGGALLAATLAAIVLMTTGGGPSIQDVAAAALNAPTRPAPPPDPDDEQYIRARVGGVSFPDYARRWGWAAVGARTDRVDGRRATTVIYRRGDRGVHYSIVDGDPLPVPEGARRVEADGLKLAVLRGGGALMVTWRRGGRTCVLASRTLDAADLVRLATWQL